MRLEAVMQQFGGHSGDFSDHQLKFIREVDLTELTEELDAWSNVWDQLDPQTVDQRRYRERRRLQQELKLHAQGLADMTFRLEVPKGYSREFIRASFLQENPTQEHLIKELFDSASWWLLVAHSEAADGSRHLNFCHVNTRKVAQLVLSAESPAISNFTVADPIAPRGKIIIFTSEHQESPAG